jgi:cytochrome c-type biogenesis protein CcmH/NrfF
MKSILFAALVAFLFLPSAQASYGQGDPRLEKLYTSFMAPCCWRDNLAEHSSPEAESLRGRIATMVRDGESDGTIQAKLVAEYGQRILTLPEGATRQWLFWTPWLMGAAGLAAIFAWMRRSRSHALPANGLPPADLPEGWDRE